MLIHEYSFIKEFFPKIQFFCTEIGRHFRGLFREEIPNIPRYGQKLSDIGKFLRRDLKVPKNLKTIFKSSRNYLAANNVVGVGKQRVTFEDIDGGPSTSTLVANSPR